MRIDGAGRPFPEPLLKPKEGSQISALSPAAAGLEAGELCRVGHLTAFFCSSRVAQV